MVYATLVSIDALRAHLHDPAWVVVDCRFRLTEPAAGRRLYDAGHIPGARYADLDLDLAAPITPNTGRHPLPDRQTFARCLGAWGIGANTQVVAYDDAGGAIAARLWWLLRWVGHEASAVLDGGIGAWIASEGALETTMPAIDAVCFTPCVDAMPHVDASFVTTHVLGASTALLLDARSPDRFRGVHEPIDPVKGHVPGALNRPFERNLGADGRFLSPPALAQAFGAVLGNIAARDVVHMCGSGVTACHNLLAMEIAGLTGSRLYPGSWSEWIRDPARPIATEAG